MTDIYVNFFMLTHETTMLFLFIFFNFLTRYSVVFSIYILNVVFAILLAKFNARVKLIYPRAFFVQLNNSAV